MYNPIEWAFGYQRCFTLLSRHANQIALVVLTQSWREMVEDIHCPSPQPEDHASNEDPGFHEDPDIYIEFDDGVFYQASLDGSEVAITSDYPRLYPVSILSIQKASQKRSPYLHLIHYTKLYFIGSALGKPHSLESGL